MHRNIAKSVEFTIVIGMPVLTIDTSSQFHPDDDSAQAVLTYAVDHLGVEHGAFSLTSLS